AATLAPTSNLVLTDMVTLLSERFLYVPLLGLALALGAGLEAYLRSSAPLALRAGSLFATGVAVVAYGAGAGRRSPGFADEGTLWARELALHPESLEAIRYGAAKDIRYRHFDSALAMTARGQSVAAMWYRPLGYEVDFILQGIEVFLARTPDRERATLERV